MTRSAHREPLSWADRPQTGPARPNRDASPRDCERLTTGTAIVVNQYHGPGRLMAHRDRGGVPSVIVTGGDGCQLPDAQCGGGIRPPSTVTGVLGE